MTAEQTAGLDPRPGPTGLTVLAQPPVPAEDTPSAAGRDSLLGAMLQTISDLMFRLRRDGVILEFHAPADNEFALTAEAVTGRRVTELLPPQAGPLAMHYLEKTLRSGAPQRFSCQHALPGRVRVFDARLAECGPGEVLALVRDVTERETLEREIVESRHRMQMRIGQDLHDGLGQQLTGISFLSRALEKGLAAQARPEAADAAEISRQVIAAVAQTRHLARGLFPVELEESGLVSALDQLARNVEELCQIPCAFACDEALPPGAPEAATHLFRLAQEAANNAVKHGKARRVEISLRRADDSLVLTIQDDGIGFPSHGTQSGGLGLRTMKYRAQKVGGALEILRAAHGGSIIRCVFPPGGGAPVHPNSEENP